MDIQAPFYSGKKFRDPQNFPYGFARSGEFTIEQARMIESYGHAYHELSSGVRQPNGVEEQEFVDFCNDEKEAETNHQLAWKRYLNRVNRSRTIYSLAGSSAVNSLAHEVEVSTG